MRYFLQAAAMLGDLALILASACVLYSDWRLWWMVAIAFAVWHQQGGFIAWQPSSIRSFMANAKKLGL